MNRRFDPFTELERAVSSALRPGPSSAAVPLDLYRQDETYVAAIDLPGVDADSIDVDVEDRTLTIRAERRAAEADDIQWLARERSTGTFARQLTLGAGLALDKITADYADGVLTLRIPVAEEAKPRKIQVTSTSGRSTIEAD